MRDCIFYFKHSLVVLIMVTKMIEMGKKTISLKKKENKYKERNHFNVYELFNQIDEYLTYAEFQ